MDDEIRREFWKEVELLQPIIGKFDTITGQMKNWFVTSLVAVIGFSFLQGKPKFLLLNGILILGFYLSEVAYRLAHDAFLTRTRKIEAILRGECEFTSEHRPPHLDKHLLHGREEAVALMKHSKKMVSQIRVSGLYWFGAVITGACFLLHAF